MLCRQLQMKSFLLSFSTFYCIHFFFLIFTYGNSTTLITFFSCPIILSSLPLQETLPYQGTVVLTYLTINTLCSAVGQACKLVLFLVGCSVVFVELRSRLCGHEPIVIPMSHRTNLFRLRFPFAQSRELKFAVVQFLYFSESVI